MQYNYASEFPQFFLPFIEKKKKKIEEKKKRQYKKEDVPS